MEFIAKIEAEPKTWLEKVQALVGERDTKLARDYIGCLRQDILQDMCARREVTVDHTLALSRLLALEVSNEVHSLQALNGRNFDFAMLTEEQLHIIRTLGIQGLI